MKQETDKTSQPARTDPPKGEPHESRDKPFVLLGNVEMKNREPTLLDSRGEPVRDTQPDASSKEGTMDYKETERSRSTWQTAGAGEPGAKEVSRKASSLVEQAAEGAKDVAQTAGQTASQAAGHAKEGMKDVASDLATGAKQVGTTAQKAAGHTIESGKDILGDIKGGAKDLANTVLETAGEAKEVIEEVGADIVETVRETKDRAKHSMSSAIHQVGPSLRRANRATGAFVATNAVPISLLGFGAGWLMMSSRRRQSMRPAAPRTEGMLSATTGIASETLGAATTPEIGAEAADLAKRTSDKLHDVAEGALKTVQHAAGETRHRVAEIKDRATYQVQHARDVVSERATKLKHGAGHQLDRAKDATVHLAESKPFVLLALSLGAGMSTAMLFPSSKPEKRLMGATRDRLIGEAGDTAARVGEVARKTARELRTNISP